MSNRNGNTQHVPKNGIKSGSIQQGADFLIELIEREKAKAVEQTWREYVDLERRFAEFRLASDVTVKTALDRSQAWHRAIQRAQDEAKKFREMYQRLQDIVQQSPVVGDLLQSPDMSSDGSLDLVAVLPEILKSFEKTQIELAASKQKCAELRRERDSDIRRLNSKIAELQEEFDAFRASSESDDATAAEDTTLVEANVLNVKTVVSRLHESSPVPPDIPLRWLSHDATTPQVTNQTETDDTSPLNLTLLNHAQPHSLEVNGETHVTSPGGILFGSQPVPLKTEQSSPTVDRRHPLPVKLEHDDSTGHTQASKPRLSLTELRALIAQKNRTIVTNAQTGESSGNRSSQPASHPPITLVSTPDRAMIPAPEGTDLRRYCVCNQLAYGDMIACDAQGCSREWFHLACVGLTVAPEGSWKCSECSGSSTLTCSL
ncbi:hypothetical protein NEOLEDRAFT_1243021 [Neolentinus lepideus HHB14362 ss-1]|uniref:PHD-type domain-containing protein n=1 Tax=Neolentinus lepideus HHB14362 ss-1 TaxID=1314782 RepID=A0A165RCR8_9AGAM|nr:hypothetical protein NEOLEDRAFT_1243021 [Neolentinus lepideus HHB14362 ss-1]